MRRRLPVVLLRPCALPAPQNVAFHLCSASAVINSFGARPHKPGRRRHICPAGKIRADVAACLLQLAQRAPAHSSTGGRCTAQSGRGGGVGGGVRRRSRLMRREGGQKPRDGTARGDSETILRVFKPPFAGHLTSCIFHAFGEGQRRDQSGHCDRDDVANESRGGKKREALCASACSR